MAGDTLAIRDISNARGKRAHMSAKQQRETKFTRLVGRNWFREIRGGAGILAVRAPPTGVKIALGRLGQLDGGNNLQY